MIFLSTVEQIMEKYPSLCHFEQANVLCDLIKLKGIFVMRLKKNYWYISQHACNHIYPILTFNVAALCVQPIFYSGYLCSFRAHLYFYFSVTRVGLQQSSYYIIERDVALNFL